MSNQERRHFSRDYKLKVIERMDAGENVSAVSVELGVKRELLYRWRSALRAGGELALRSGPGRPKRAEAAAMAAARGPAEQAGDLAAAQRTIAALERTVGRQQRDLDFFRQALRHLEASRRPNDGSGGTASSPASKR